MEIMGYRRPNGQVGIRNRILVIYTVVCSEEVARKIVNKCTDAVLIGWRSCHANTVAVDKLIRLACHPNIGGVLVVAHGCECTDAREIVDQVRESGKPVRLLTVQEVGGTLATLTAGLRAVEEIKFKANVPRVPVRLSNLIVGLECGGSDTTSGLAANPAVGWAADQIIANGGRTVFEEVGEMWGCEEWVFSRATNKFVRDKMKTAFHHTKVWAEETGVEMFSSGNLAGGLTNIMEKSMGAVIKTGTTPIVDVLDGVRGERVQDQPGAYLLDSTMYRGTMSNGSTDVSDPIGVTELIAAGAHIVLFTTGRGSVTGSGVAPVIKITGNPKTYERLRDDMDINAGTILTGSRTVDQVGQEILDEVQAVAAGKLTKSELLEHFEFHI